MRAKELKADLLLLITAAIWGAAFVAQRTGMDHVGPMTFNGVRFLLGAAALAPYALSGRDATTPGLLSGRPALMAGLATGLLLFVAASFQQAGMQYTTAGNAGFITGLYVLFVPMAGLFLGQRPVMGVWLGAVMCAVGLYLLSITADFTIGYGDSLELVCAVLFAGHVLLIGWLAPRMSPSRLSCLQYLTCGLLSLIAAFAMEQPTMEGIRGAAIPILYGGLLSVGVAYTLQVIAQKDAPPAHASIILSLEGAFAALAGWYILGETLTPRAMTGCALMLAGMLAAQLWPEKK